MQVLFSKLASSCSCWSDLQYSIMPAGGGVSTTLKPHEPNVNGPHFKLIPSYFVNYITFLSSNWCILVNGSELLFTCINWDCYGPWLGLYNKIPYKCNGNPLRVQFFCFVFQNMSKHIWKIWTTQKCVLYA